MSKCTTLRIKRVYFDRILNGEKRREFRKVSPYYESLFKVKPKRLKLHYQQAARLEVEVLRIRKIKTPKHLDPSLGFGEKVFEISLGKILKYES